MNPQAPWRVVLIERHGLLNDLLAKVIRLHPRFILSAQAYEPDEAIELASRVQPDLVVTEVEFGVGDGLKMIERLTAKRPPVRMLVVSDCREAHILKRLAQIGVLGFIEKDQSLEILEEAMIEVASGRKYFTARMARLQEGLGRVSTPSAHALSARERQILRLVARGLTSRDIAGQLNLSVRSVETYRYRMMRRFGIEGTAGLIRFGLKAEASSNGAVPADPSEDKAA